MTEMEQFGAQLLSVKKNRKQARYRLYLQLWIPNLFYAKTRYSKAQWSQIIKFWGGLIVSIPY